MSFKSAFSQTYKTKLFWLIEHLLFIMIPLTVITSRPHDKVLGYAVLLVSLTATVCTAVFMGITSKDLGLTAKHFKAAIAVLFFPTVLIAIVIVIGRVVLPQAFVIRASSKTIVLQYVFLSVPIQELLFRGLCLWRCRLSFHNFAFVILFNSADFAFYHVIFGNWWLVAGVFLVSLIWSYVFSRHPNLYATILSHAVLGALVFGFV